MDTPFDHLMRLQKDMTTVLQQMTQVLKKVNDLEAKVVSSEANTILVMGLIAAKDLNKEFENHLKSVSISRNHTEIVKAAASEFLRQKALWPDEAMSKMKQ